MNAQHVQEQGQPMMMMPAETVPPRPHNGIVLPVLLIGLGVLFLLSSLEIMDWSSWNNLWRLWPLILVAFGLEILIGRRSLVGSLLIGLLLLVTVVFALTFWAWQPYSGQVTTTESISQALKGATKADVNIDFGAGTLRLAGLSDADRLISGSISRGDGETVSQDFYVSNGTAYYTLKSKIDWGVSFFRSDPQDRTWDLRLNQSVPTDLSINKGAGDATLDLERLNVTNLDMNLGVGDTDLTVPAQGDVSSTIDAGVGDVTISIPEGMAARIQVNSGLGNTNVPDNYARRGDVYVSPGFDNARDRIELNIDRGVGDVTIRTIAANTQSLR